MSMFRIIYSTYSVFHNRQAIEKGHKLLKSLDLQVVRRNSMVNMMQGRVKKLREELLAAETKVALHQDQAVKFEEQVNVLEILFIFMLSLFL